MAEKAPSKLTWFTTGASAGFGYELAGQALAKDNQVIATSRSVDRLGPFKAKGADVVALDHNHSFDLAQSAVNEALGIY